ncbi:hypothetical protein BURPS1106B_A1760 [Burkholderia pseudomallei 1106b]|uniref:Uncharacterized protein n=1 Tax=Burkholderia pseudomallei (strain 1106a) TaxID=357348 RepID=A3NWS1_BURP0|nr:hypothetical protein BURPS1106A_2533 [Burkholderia pseudomallei 1106a]EES26463.1 hypothetical protein BURPS1106B_A1760 [Burkholderia pseudomallei 1106b]
MSAVDSRDWVIAGASAASAASVASVAEAAEVAEVAEVAEALIRMGAPTDGRFKTR